MINHKQHKQIPMDFGSLPALARGDFQIGESNKEAVAWIDRWPSWCAPIVIVQGPPASGKSHLAAVWQEQSRAITIKPDQLITKSAEDIFNLGDVFLLDGLDPWLGDHHVETQLFHLYNMLKESDKTMLMTMRMAPVHSDFTIPDLASRFRAAPNITIHPPDDMLLASVMIKHFGDRQLAISHDIIAYILPRMERSFAAARDIVALADQRALAEKRGISIPLMRLVLADMQE